MLLDERQFLLIWGIRIIPLLHIRQAVAKGAVAGYLTVLPKAPGSHKGFAEGYHGFQLIR